MRIQKIGHACMLIEHKGTKILVDPGAYSTEQNNIEGIDAILITHEHKDHCDTESIRKILERNPRATIFTNASAHKLLAKDRIKSDVIEDGESVTVRGVPIERFGDTHAMIHRSMPLAENGGYFITPRFFYPGDMLRIPPRAVEILALPIMAPWATLGESIDYALEVKPKICFPVHDALLAIKEPYHRIPSHILEPAGIRFEVIDGRDDFSY